MMMNDELEWMWKDAAMLFQGVVPGMTMLFKLHFTRNGIREIIARFHKAV
jgi:hypothetical protein